MMPTSQQYVTSELHARDMHRSTQQMFIGVDYSTADIMLVKLMYSLETISLTAFPPFLFKSADKWHHLVGV